MLRKFFLDHEDCKGFGLVVNIPFWGIPVGSILKNILLDEFSGSNMEDCGENCHMEC